jgi:hypothetical protein
MKIYPTALELFPEYMRMEGLILIGASQEYEGA